MFTRQDGSWSHDPEYQTNRKTVRSWRDDCARCGGPIDYDAPYWITVAGRRTINRTAFHCGHIVDRATAGGHPDHSLGNLQAEHAGCSVSSGARSGARRRWAGAPRPGARPATAGLY